MPYFYSAVDRMVADGQVAFTINRRTIAAEPSVPERLPDMWAQIGKTHPGHDCFVFPRAWIPEMELGAITTGVPWIGFILLANLACLGRDIRVHEDAHLTFHLGDDQAWTNPADLPYREHNSREALGVQRKLENRYGHFPRESYLGQHVTLAESQVRAFEKARAEGQYGRESETKNTQKTVLAMMPGPRKTKPNKRYIFSINSGRSGSEYLSRLLGTAQGVIGGHEVEPTMSGQWLQAVGGAGFEATFDGRMVKAQAIAKTMEAAPDGAVYVETNHMFIKTFWDVIVKTFDPEAVDVVVLRRHLPSVLKSFINLGYFSSRNGAWPHWMHLVGTKGSLVEPLGPVEALDQYELAIGYLLDIEARAQQFVSAKLGCGVHEVRLEELQTPDAVGRLFGGLRLSATEATVGAIGRRVNDRSSTKAQVGIRTSLEYCEHRLQVYLDLCNRRGIELPPLPQLLAA